MVFVFVLTLAVSFIVVRIGAIAFQLTGLEWSLAKFQALSCFTGTGFTTKEAELITGNMQRRKIASVLMVLGNAGLVILVATFASSLIPRETILARITKLFLPSDVSSDVVRWINLLIIVIAVAVVYKVFTNPRVTNRLTEFLRKRVIKKQLLRRVSVEELLMTTGGYGVSRVTVPKNSPVIDKTLVEARVRQSGITILAIVRGDKTIANPSAKTTIKAADELICFGELESIRNTVLFKPGTK